jgi:SAM-dependent methyltransferase
MSQLGTEYAAEPARPADPGLGVNHGLQNSQLRNPHFDDGLVVWSDEYSGRYYLPSDDYSGQFDLQWRLCLEDYYQTLGVSVDDEHISDRIFEWTGQRSGDLSSYHPSEGLRPLDHPLDINLIKDKECIDVGCGLGRWTKTMLTIGARSVTSVDMSQSALESVRRFNSNVVKADVMKLQKEHPEFTGKFDFANLWGVAMCTHDPLKAFLSAASTVKPGGALYLMVYAPEGMHGTKIVNLQRGRFAQLQTLDQRLAYVEHVYQREWDNSYSLKENLKNILRNVLGRPKGSKVGALDMLEPFYNWVIPLDVIDGWMTKAGFKEVRLLNEFEKKKCAYHVLGIKTS